MPITEKNISEAIKMANEEIRSRNETTGGEKGVKLERFDLVPVKPLTALARHYGVGAQKYADRNWEKGYEWSKSYAALQRHLSAFWGGEDVDPETGSHHLDAAGFHVFAMREWGFTHPELDDRPNTNPDETVVLRGEDAIEVNRLIHEEKKRLAEKSSGVSFKESYERAMIEQEKEHLREMEKGVWRDPNGADGPDYGPGEATQGDKWQDRPA